MVPGNQSGEHLINAWFKTKIVNEEEKKIKETENDENFTCMSCNIWKIFSNAVC